MAKGKSTWKYNKLLTARRNYFAIGDPIERVTGVSPSLGTDLSGIKPPTTIEPMSLGSKSGNFLSGLTGGVKGIMSGNGIAGVTTALGSAVGNAISGGMSSTAGNIVGGLGDLAQNIPVVGKFAGPALKIVGGGINALFGSKLNEANIEAAKNDIARMNNAKSNASSFDTLAATIGSTAGRTIHNKSYYGKEGVFSNAATNVMNDLESQAEIADRRQTLAFLDNADNLIMDQLNNLQANYTAFGGPLKFRDGGDTSRVDFSTYSPFLNRKFIPENMEQLQDSLIARNIPKPMRAAILGTVLHESGGDPSAKSVSGKYKGIVQWGDDRYPNTEDLGKQIHVLMESMQDSSSPNWGYGGNGAPETKSGKEAYNKFWSNGLGPYGAAMIFNKGYVRPGATTNPEKVKNAEQTRVNRGVEAKRIYENMKAFGGELHTNGANFTNGILSINSGGSHESNPFEGVPMGVDNEGTPNLVEEGETIFNDYVFSKRLKVPKSVRNKYKLGGPISFADATKKLAKESEERPNDPISINGLRAIMSDLASAQEELKASKKENSYANGGKVNKFDDGGYDWDPFFTALSGYTTSRIKGNTAGKYRPDRALPMAGNPYMLGAADINALEENPDYVSFTKSMIANPNMDYLRMLDEGVAEGVPHLIGSDGKLVSNWAQLFENRRNDQKGGIYHWTPLMAAQATQNNPSSPVTPVTPAEDPKKTYDRYYYNTGTRDNPNYVLLEGQDNAPLWMRNNKYNYRDMAERSDGKDYYYDPNEPLNLGRNPLEPLRYAPIGLRAITALTDAAGLTNKPYYGNADAIAEASRTSGIYSPVRYNPVGNKLRPEEFDRDFYINKLNADAGATRRAILQNAGLNRGAGMAALLASDYNTQGQLGQLARQAAEFNDAQRMKVEEFNRGTNMTNSQGFLQADIANQNALSKLGEMNFKGALAAAQMRESIRQQADANKSANISGLFTDIANLGNEAKSDNMIRRLIEAGVLGPGAQRVYMGANGGKLNRKKKRGLTL